MNSNPRPDDAGRPASFFERFGERVMAFVIGPVDRIPQLYKRGWMRFALTRGASYATVMLAGLFVMTLMARVPIFRSGFDAGPFVVRFASYWVAQFLLGAVLSLFLWRMVRRIALYKAVLSRQRADQRQG